MKRFALPAALWAGCIANPALAEDPLEQGFAGALRGCEEWILNPKTWTDTLQPFVDAVALGDTMGLVDTIPDVAQPPAAMRSGNVYWRINSTLDAGYFLVVSYNLPICHISGGGQQDLQPVVERVLASDDFRARWDELEKQGRDGITMTTFRNRNEPKLEIVISRADKPGERRDRVQVLATGQFEIGALTP